MKEENRERLSFEGRREGKKREKGMNDKKEGKERERERERGM